MPHFTVAEDLQLFYLTQVRAASDGAAARASRSHHLHGPPRALVWLRWARAQQCPAGNQPEKQRRCSLPGSFVKSCTSSSTAGHRPQESRGPPPAAGLGGAAGVWTQLLGRSRPRSEPQKFRITTAFLIICVSLNKIYASYRTKCNNLVF